MRRALYWARNLPVQPARCLGALSLESANVPELSFGKPKGPHFMVILCSESSTVTPHLADL